MSGFLPWMGEIQRDVRGQENIHDHEVFDATGRQAARQVRLQQAVAALDERMGFIPDPAATAEQAQSLMRASGVRPEDRILSSEIIRMRHEKEEE